MINAALYDAKPYDCEYFERFSKHNNIDWHFHEFRLSAKTAASAAGMHAVCVFVNDRIDRACILELAKLEVKLIALRCAGFNNVDLLAAKELGVSVARVPAYSPYAVAEHTIGLLLTLNRHIHRAYNRVREHNFSLNGLVGFDLAGKTIGIIGTGKIGRITAQIFRGFNCRVVAFDVTPHLDWAKQYNIEYTQLESLLQNSDIISLHVPLTPETHHLICRETLQQIKQGAFLINTSRGKLVDTTALIESLKKNHLGGVALDVYEEEEGIFFEDHSEHLLQDDELNLLLTFPNVLITSHQAFLTQEALSEIALTTINNIVQFTSNKPINPENKLC
ncbi:MAG TPA: 2-hydroxyacid dehydrogenase [Nitrosomonas sp.]|nr:2-hydroxyacid dehydrogenase [Nitrosomonas sp.]HQX13599.1 2-hydroxyacid dehydrogenase [Nitrosomonas sp.]HRB20423.1 2-hydroxyacid dehydrogenase [Nitrosomonas sp.]HRB32985.1 2-hydroxyacid dehydrogenase [Nitrosomonas sp.]HRB45646.1 2-hydroxyacid dehydrogenase [Nitrosomonas sp.]